MLLDDHEAVRVVVHGLCHGKLAVRRSWRPHDGGTPAVREPIRRELAASAARVRGQVIGVDEDAYPLDAGSTMRYHPTFAALPPRHPLPAPLDVTEIDRFVQCTTASYPLTWSGPASA